MLHRPPSRAGAGPIGARPDASGRAGRKRRHNATRATSTDEAATLGTHPHGRKGVVRGASGEPGRKHARDAMLVCVPRARAVKRRAQAQQTPLLPGPAPSACRHTASGRRQHALGQRPCGGDACVHTRVHTHEPPRVHFKKKLAAPAPRPARAAQPPPPSAAQAQNRGAGPSPHRRDAACRSLPHASPFRGRTRAEGALARSGGLPPPRESQATPLAHQQPPVRRCPRHTRAPPPGNACRAFRAPAAGALFGARQRRRSCTPLPSPRTRGWKRRQEEARVPW